MNKYGGITHYVRHKLWLCLGYIILIINIMIFNANHNRHIFCQATGDGDNYCKEGNINDRDCKDKKTVEIDFQSPGRDKTYYHKNIRLMLSKSIFGLLNSNTAFCFTLYNQNNKQSFDKCVYKKEEIAEFIYPKHITVRGLGEGTIDLAAWMKDKNTELPIESTWVSYSFYVTFECIKNFDSVPSFFLEMEQVDLQSVILTNAPLCYDFLKHKIKNSRNNTNRRLDTVDNNYNNDITFRNKDNDNQNNNKIKEDNLSEKLLRNYLDVKSGSRGVFGVPFYEQSFGHGDRIFLDFILASKPNYKSIVEFGTFKGLTSLYLGMSARLRSRAKNFQTFDIVDLRQPHIISSWLGNMNFNLADLEKVPLNTDVVKSIINTDFLFVDGGNKHVEAVLYAGLLKVGSGIFIHDYQYDNENFDSPSERFPELEEMGFTPFYDDAAMLFNSCGRFWIREKQLQTFDLRIWLTNLGCVSVTHCDVSKTWKGHFGL